MDPAENITRPPLSRSIPRILLRLIVVAGLVWTGLALFEWLQGHIDMLEAAARQRMLTTLVVLAVLAYAIIIAIPFVPGIEIAIALMVMEGAILAPFVWIATVLGLGLAYFVGRRVSLDWLEGLFRDLHMVRACQMLHRIKTEPQEKRLEGLSNRLPNWVAPLATRYRYFMLALLLNIPGNVALGGGGGIMMVAGISRLFRNGTMLVVVGLATAPVPLAVWFMGADVLM